MIESVEEAGAWLEGLLNVEKRPDWPYARFSLAPIRGLLARLGDPHAGLRAIHVTGSKGKGSTVLLAEAVLSAAGERVGTYTSPHLERWSERVRRSCHRLASMAASRSSSARRTSRQVRIPESRRRTRSGSRSAPCRQRRGGAARP